jgi:hypothetical protein
MTSDQIEKKKKTGRRKENNSIVVLGAGGHVDKMTKGRDHVKNGDAQESACRSRLTVEVWNLAVGEKCKESTED